MKSRAILGLAVVFAVSAIAADWTDYTSAKYKYSAKFPGKTTEKDQGKLNIVMFEKDASTAYTVITSSLGVNVAPDATARVLDATRDGFVKGANGTLVDEKKITVGKYPGREINVKTIGGAYMRARLYLVNDILYQVIAGGSKELVGNADTTKFMDSFKLAN